MSGCCQQTFINIATGNTPAAGKGGEVVEFELEVEKVLREMQQQMQANVSERTHRDITTGQELLWQLESHLSVTERTWSRLPPLVSNRRGWKAQVELWFKRQFKRATWWFVWEQVNFNAATHDALRTLLTALARQKERELELCARLDELQATLHSLKTAQQNMNIVTPADETYVAAPAEGEENSGAETRLF
jgi:hypothetical protein